VVTQILPYLTQPLLEINMTNQDVWSWMSRTNIQVQGDTLFYVEPVDVPFLGTAHTINMLNVNTLEKTTLLSPSGVNYTGRYELYNWKIAGETLHFSGLKKDNNSVIMGGINIGAYEDGAMENEFLTINEVASATEAFNQIVDIEIIRDESVFQNPTKQPDINLVSDADTNYSAGLDFSVPMDKHSVVESYLTLTSDNPLEGNAGTIDYLSVWINNSMHIIPDLDGLGDSTDTTPLTFGTQYQLTLPSDIEDAFGNKTTHFSDSVDLKPLAGWYVSGNGQLKHAREDGNPNNSSIHNVFASGTVFENTSLSENFELTLDVTDADYSKVHLRLNDWDSANNDAFFETDISNFSVMRVKSEGYYLYGGKFIGEISERTFRVRLYGANLTIDSKPIGSADSEYSASQHHSETAVDDRTGSDYRFSIKASDEIALDNIRFIELDTTGAYVDSGLEAILDFNDGTLPDSFKVDITDEFIPAM